MELIFQIFKQVLFVKKSMFDWLTNSNADVCRISHALLNFYEKSQGPLEYIFVSK
jgi:hypothetical protein